ncbi:hypothetical protein TSUD_276830 [Trifolium subterraneum]|uniref:Uncharacterized protein n=1 Tax=Trifolium subterraneum TaxID=3900 RepID=A0A2Z6N1E7_TRISU|nr:hypothetical protein TSUD_276830 [Trifolium subterraneum]
MGGEKSVGGFFKPGWREEARRTVLRNVLQNWCIVFNHLNYAISSGIPKDPILQSNMHNI